MDEQDGIAKMKSWLLSLLLLLSCAVNNNAVVFDNGASFEVELAETSERHAQGLMFREKLEEDKGMLFVFPDQQIRTIWMKNTKIPLDIIFLDSNKTVVDIAQMQPCFEDVCQTYSAIAKYVLEVNAGTSANKSISKGMQADFK